MRSDEDRVGEVCAINSSTKSQTLGSWSLELFKLHARSLARTWPIAPSSIGGQSTQSFFGFRREPGTPGSKREEGDARGRHACSAALGSGRL